MTWDEYRQEVIGETVLVGPDFKEHGVIRDARKEGQPGARYVLFLVEGHGWTRDCIQAEVA